MKKRKKIDIIGYASSIAGPDPLAGEGPLTLKKSPYLAALHDRGLELAWDMTIIPDLSNKTKLQAITHDNQQLANEIRDFVDQQRFFMVLGGDHASAIGTWSGVHESIKNQGPLGLIWIDAHMDSHTPETTLTGNYHGMPLACLLGYGEDSLISIQSKQPKIKPEHLCLIGIRSFEEEERELLERLKIRIYYMDEIEQRGLNTVMKEALTIVTEGTAGFGISLDIDSIDPQDAPATDVSEAGGLRATDLCAALSLIAHDDRLIGVEITEFDPHRDIDHKTEKLIPELMMVLAGH